MTFDGVTVKYAGGRFLMNHRVYKKRYEIKVFESTSGEESTSSKESTTSEESTSSEEKDLINFEESTG